MEISDLHVQISEIKNSDPNLFSFLFDTTDRTFMYTSKNCELCEQLVIDLDVNAGIELLTKHTGRFVEEGSEYIIALRQLEPHAFVGFCSTSQEFHTTHQDLIASFR